MEGEPLGADAPDPDPPVRPDTLSEDEPFEDPDVELAAAPAPVDVFVAPAGAEGVAAPD